MRVNASATAVRRHVGSGSMLCIADSLATVGAWAVDLESSVVTWSDTTAALHDAPRGTSPSLQAAIAYWAEEHRESVRRAFEACARDGTPFELEGEIVGAAGRRRWVRSTGEPVRDASGAITHVRGALQDISEHKAREAQGQRWLEAIEGIAHGCFMLDRELRFTYVNAEAERLLRKPRAELLGRGLCEACPSVAGSTFEQEYRRTLTSGQAATFEAHCAPFDQWFEVHAYARDGLTVFFRDVTERHESRDALHESERRFRSLASATNDAIWEWDLLTEALWYNEGVTALFGLRLDEIGPRIDAWTSRIHPDDRGAVIASLRAAIDGELDSWRESYRFRRKDGSYAWVIDRGTILRDGDGKPVRMIGGMTDVTERRRTEEQLRQQAALLDKAPDAIHVRGLDDRVTYWNRGAERLYGFRAEEAVGRPFCELLRRDPERLSAARAAVLANGEWTGELEEIARDGRPKIVEARWTLLRDEHGGPASILAIDTDVTERRTLEAQFLRAQRLESLGTLAGGIAHDLNNVLAPISMSVSLLLEGELDPERVLDLSTIEKCARRGAELVRQLLAFARGTGGRRAPVDLGRIAAETRNFVRETFPKDVSCRLELPRTRRTVNADPTQMQQLLTNLCVNARDAMPGGGTLTIAVDEVVLDEIYAQMNRDARPGPYVRIRVEDTGVGMAPEILDRIFEPFFTTKQAGGGSGVGLSTVLAIVRGHLGFITVHSQPGRGTRFDVHLPANADAVEDAPPASAPASSPEGGQGKLVLVVDDEEGVRRVMRRALERFGYRTLLAGNGAEAVSAFALHRGEIAIVITDMHMPVMDGPATVVALRTIDPNVRIVASSGAETDAKLAKARAAGVRHVLPKPYSAEQLLDVLRRAAAATDEADP